MERYDLPVADRYHELDDEVITVLNNLHNKAEPYFQDLEYFGQEPIRGMLRTDVAALNRTDGLEDLKWADTTDIKRLFNLDRRYRRATSTSDSEIVLGVDSRYDPETNKEYLDFYATKVYPKKSRFKKLGAQATQLAKRAKDLYETKAQPRLRGLQRKLGSLASRIAQPVLQR